MKKRRHTLRLHNISDLKIFLEENVKITGSSLTMAKMLRAEKRKQAKIQKKIFEQLWKVVQNTKVVNYFDNSKGIFFSRPKSQWFGCKSSSKFIDK